MLKTDLFLGLISLSFVPIIAWRGTATGLKLRSNWLIIQEKLSMLTKVIDEKGEWAGVGDRSDLVTPNQLKAHKEKMSKIKVPKVI